MKRRTQEEAAVREGGGGWWGWATGWGSTGTEEKEEEETVHMPTGELPPFDQPSISFLLCLSHRKGITSRKRENVRSYWVQ